MARFRYAAGLWIVGGAKDRFVEYRPPVDLRTMLDMMRQVEHIEAVEIPYVGPFDIDATRRELERAGLAACSLITGTINGPRWKFGSLSCLDESLRRAAVDEVKRTCDAAVAMGCSRVTVWMGQDGFDYPFQLDYGGAWDRLVRSLGEVCAYAPDVLVGLEYKPKEPRTHSLLSNVDKTILACEEVGASNLGIVLDFGHSLNAGENPAEAATTAASRGRLFFVHMNDNYREWDDDLVPGTVHVWETLEFLFQLKALDYDGWISVDQAPRREDPVKTAVQAIRNIEALARLAESINVEQLRAMQGSCRIDDIMAYLSDLLFEET